MAITTAGDLIALALRSSGILGQGQSAAAEDSSDALAYLNMMVAQWQRKRWLVPSLVDTAVVSTGAAFYTVGVGGTVPIARPDRIDYAFARLLPSGSQLAVDYPLAIIESREDYNTLGLKSLATFPAAVFYQSSYPLGVLYFWPIPAAAQFELHITTKAALPVYTGLTDAINLPPEYIEALLYSLAVRLCMNYGQAPRPDMLQAMRAALNTVRMANVQIPTLAMPGAVLPRRGGSVSASSDPHFQTGWW